LIQPPRFEVNTDVELLGPNWEDFTALHEHRYGLAIAYVKEAIKGTSYSNAVMKLVVGPSGFYAQSKNFPAAFYGDLGELELRWLSLEEAQALAFEAVALYRAGEAQSLTALYSELPADVFFGYRASEGERFELGHIRPTLPLHLRVMVDAPEVSELLGDRKGALIYQRTASGAHLMLRAPGRRQPFALLDGFQE
jgi:hypothetical protein